MVGELWYSLGLQINKLVGDFHKQNNLRNLHRYLKLYINKDEEEIICTIKSKLSEKVVQNFPNGKIFHD